MTTLFDIRLVVSHQGGGQVSGQVIELLTRIITCKRINKYNEAMKLRITLVYLRITLVYVVGHT